jgi:ribosome-associated translation inhibitor RaiA
MTKLEAPDFHADEAVIVLDVSSKTTLALDTLEARLGSNSKAAFTALNLALDNLLTILTKVKSELNDRKKSLVTNRAFVDFSVIRIPDPDIPSLVDASKTINQVLGNISTPDINDLHQSVSLAELIRGPDAISAFEKEKIALVGAELDFRISRVSSAQDNVNSLKKIIESKT